MDRKSRTWTERESLRVHYFEELTAFYFVFLLLGEEMILY